MTNLFDYLQWRGDIPFSQVGVNDVDALIFSTLAYIHYDGIVPQEPQRWVLLKNVSRELFALPEPEKRCRVPRDLELLMAASQTVRFGSVGLSFYQNIFIPEEDTQFAAVSFFTEDLTAYLAFRGTDNTLVGWKEDFNMTFQESIPSQRLAQEYTGQFAATCSFPLRLGGHSKGGNLAVYAAAKSDSHIQSRIMEVHNQDGPGFSAAMMEDPGYQAIVSKIRSFIPQSSVIGMLLEHEEPYIIVKSSQVGLMQHDPYTWELMGGSFTLVQELTADSLFLDKTFKKWLAGMSNEERNTFFDTVFELLSTGGVSNVRDILQPQNLKAYLKTLHSDEGMRHTLRAELFSLLESARNVHQQNLIESE